MESDVARNSGGASLIGPQIDALLDRRRHDLGIKELRRAIDRRELVPVPKADVEGMLRSGANTTAQAYVTSDSYSNRTVSEPELRERREAAQKTWTKGSER